MKILAACGDHTRVIGVYPHEKLREEDSPYKEQAGNNNGDLQADGHDFFDALHVVLAPILGAKNGDTGVKAEEEHIKHILDLSRKGAGGQCSLAYKTQHEGICNTYSGADKALNCNRNNYRKEGAIEDFVNRKFFRHR